MSHKILFERIKYIQKPYLICTCSMTDFIKGDPSETSMIRKCNKCGGYKSQKEIIRYESQNSS